MNFADKVILLNNGEIATTGYPLTVLTPEYILDVFDVQTCIHEVGDTRFIWVD